MNARKGKANFKKFRILLDSGFSSKILIGMLMQKPHHKEYTVMQWNTQAGKITTNIKVKIGFNLPELSATKIVTWNLHVDDSSKADII